MHYGYYNLIRSRFLRFFLIFVLAYFSQLDKIYHIHHSHAYQLVETAVNSHSEKHIDDHHHHDDGHHDDTHQHNFSSNIDWYVMRVQTQKIILLDLPDINYIINLSIKEREFFAYITNNKRSFKHKYNSFPLITRGPPQLS